MEQPKQGTLRLKVIEKTDLSSAATPSSVAATLLSDSLFPPRKPKAATAKDESALNNDTGDNEKNDPLATQVWRLYTKAKDTLPNASRMENLTWRMMAMTLNKNRSKSSTPSTPSSETMAPTDMDSPVATSNQAHMSIDSSQPAIGSSPPPADDTSQLLSSSAPPYMIDFLSGGPPFQRSASPGIATNTHRQHRQSNNHPRNKSVFVYGSTRATSSSSSTSSPTCASPQAAHVSIGTCGDKRRGWIKVGLCLRGETGKGYSCGERCLNHPIVLTLLRARYRYPLPRQPQ